MKLLLNDDESNIEDSLIEIISSSGSIKILSPYITKNKAVEILISNKYKAEIIVDFHPKTLANSLKNIDFKLLEQLHEAGVKIYYNTELHSKLYITPEQIILGSANLTSYGLVKRQESALLFDKKHNIQLYKECELFFEKIRKQSSLVTRKILDSISSILEAGEIVEKLESLIEELLITNHNKSGSDSFEKISIRDNYDSLYYYPKTLNQLSIGLTFDHIDYQKIETEFRNLTYSGKEKHKVKSEYVMANLFIKNHGYGIKTKIDKITPTIHLWCDRHADQLDFKLKSYNDFFHDRSLELLIQFKEKYNIQPVNGFFAKRFNYLIGKGTIQANFFEVNFSDFERQCMMGNWAKKLEELDAFINKHERFPDRYARYKIKDLRIRGNLTQQMEDELRNEGRLRDMLYQTSKKYRNGFFDDKDLKEFIKLYFDKWNWKG
jgi:hypothetical protein